MAHVVVSTMPATWLRVRTDRDRVLASSAVCTTKLMTEHPRTASKRNIDAAACPDARLLPPVQMWRLSVRHLSAFTRTIAKRLVKLCLSSGDHFDKVPSSI